MTLVSASQTTLLAAGLYPSASVSSSQVETRAAVAGPGFIKASQVEVLAMGIGSTFDPAVRVWTFTLDGHDYYVLRLGKEKTFVYDNLAKQWYEWGSGDEGLWKAYTGINWQGADSIAASYGSNVVVGDDANGTLYFLNPDADKDDHAVDGLDQIPFRREVYTQQVLHGYFARRCFAAYVLGSHGSIGPDTNSEVSLSYSDDRGITYKTTVPLDIQTSNKQCVWRSLGSMQYPGRIFKVVDYGAFKRLDSLETTDDVQ